MSYDNKRGMLPKDITCILRMEGESITGHFLCANEWDPVVNGDNLEKREDIWCKVSIAGTDGQ
jgi:hypothetical protein